MFVIELNGTLAQTSREPVAQLSLLTHCGGAIHVNVKNKAAPGAHIVSGSLSHTQNELYWHDCRQTMLPKPLQIYK